MEGLWQDPFPDVVASLLEYDIVVSDFEHHFRYYIHF